MAFSSYPAKGGIPSGVTAGRPSGAVSGDTYYNGETGLLEIFTTSGWQPCSSPPATPTGVTLTDASSGDAFTTTSAGKLSVAFTVGSGGGLPTNYIAYTTAGGFSASGSSSPLTLTGLTLGTSYAAYVVAQNGFGNSAASGNSANATPTTRAQAPTIGTLTATGVSGETTLTFTAPASNGGASITNYKYSTDGTTYTAFSPAQTTSPLTISGLTNGTAITVRLKAVTANGDGTASAASNSATPNVAVPVDFLVIAGGGGGGGGQPGNGVGGGGGAGGYRTSVGTSGANSSAESQLSVTGNITVTVGAGGTGSNSNATPGDATNSVFSTITATRGGFGQPGQAASTAPAVQSGGSGGGSGQSGSGGGSGTANQGTAGGSTGGSNHAGGGGGASSGGNNGANGSGGSNGGDGLANSLTGTSVTRAGGGGGGRHSSNTSGNSVGGSGGGGASTGASSGQSSNDGSAGTVNTGSGGGGAGENASARTGGNGGSGIVIIKYPDTFTLSGGSGLTFTTSTAVSGYKVTTFTAGTGTVSF